MGFFENIKGAPEDAIFGLMTAFNNDQRDKKVNLTVGVYKSSDSQTHRMRAVYEAEKMIIDKEPTKVYLPITGHRGYLEKTAKLVFGDEVLQNHDERIFMTQCLGGTGGLRIGADFLFQEITSQVHISNPTWPNHIGIFKKANFSISSYDYYDAKNS